MKTIAIGEVFRVANRTFAFDEKDGALMLKVVDSKSKTLPSNVPTEQEVKDHVRAKGYNPDFMWEKMQGYIEAGMRDSQNNPIRNWKLKLNQVWFKPEHKIQEGQIVRPPKKQI